MYRFIAIAETPKKIYKIYTLMELVWIVMESRKLGTGKHNKMNEQQQ